MKSVKTIKGLADRLAKGIFPTVNDLRNRILNPAEINYLKLTGDQIDRILKVLELDESIPLASKIKLETLLVTADKLDDSYIVQEDAKYSTLKQYIDLLNTTVEPINQYHLGHETGVLTKLLTLLRENYKPIPGADNKIVSRQKYLIDNALKASITIDSLDEKTILKMQKSGVIGTGHSAKDLKAVIQAAGYPMDLNVEVDRELTISLKKSTHKVALIAELGTTNNITGNLSRVLSNMVSAAFKSTSSKSTPIDSILKEVDLVQMTGSISMKDGLLKIYTNKFKGIRTKNEKVKSKVRTYRRIKANNSAALALKKKTKQRIASLQTKLLAVQQHKKFILPTVTLKALINESLADFIQLKMASSTAPASISYLRNQTGRFSESARLLTLNRQQTGAYFGVYTYQQEPYSVFEQGGKMGSPGRDPRLYIEGAARDIARQVLKKQFKGIALESK